MDGEAVAEGLRRQLAAGGDQSLREKELFSQVYVIMHFARGNCFAVTLKALSLSFSRTILVATPPEREEISKVELLWY